MLLGLVVGIVGASRVLDRKGKEENNILPDDEGSLICPPGKGILARLLVYEHSKYEYSHVKTEDTAQRIQDGSKRASICGLYLQK